MTIDEQEYYASAKRELKLLALRNQEKGAHVKVCKYPGLRCGNCTLGPDEPWGNLTCGAGEEK